MRAEGGQDTGSDEISTEEQERGIEEDKVGDKKEEEDEEEDALSQERATGTRTEEGEEGRAGIPLTAPPKVSKQEREEHELTHTPFRAWCPFCVMGTRQASVTRERQR